jgi:hypothetical protein
MIEAGKQDSLYHLTKGDMIAKRYVEDENWQKLLEPNTKVYGLIRDTVNYGSRAGKLDATGKGQAHDMKHMMLGRRAKVINTALGAGKSEGVREFEIAPLFRKQLKENGITPEKYLEVARELADEHGYDPRALEFSDTGNNKLMIWDDKGNKRHFGAVEYGDYILWSKQEALGKVRKGFADQKRRTFVRSHSKIKGDWRRDKFSPNNLALRILWDE